MLLLFLISCFSHEVSAPECVEHNDCSNGLTCKTCCQIISGKDNCWFQCSDDWKMDVSPDASDDTLKEVLCHCKPELCQK